jgi:WD40 repeat protein
MIHFRYFLLLFVIAASPCVAQQGSVAWVQRGSASLYQFGIAPRIEFDAAGRTMLEVLPDGFRIWDFFSNTIKANVSPARGFFAMDGEALSPDGRYIIARTKTGWVVVLDARTGALVDSAVAPGAAMALFNRAGDQVLVGAGALRSMPGLDVIRQIPSTQRTDGAFSADDRYILRLLNGLVVVDNVATGQEIRRYSGANDITRIGYVGGSERVVGYNGRELVLWNANGTTPRDIYIDRADADGSLMAMRNGGRIVVTIDRRFRTGDSTLRVWDMMEGRRTHDFAMSGLGYPIIAATMLPDEQQVALLESTGSIAIVDLSNGDIVRRIGHGHSATATVVASSRNGRFVATGGNDRMVRLFDAGLGLPVAKLGIIGDGVSALDLTSDGSIIAIARVGENGGGNSLEIRRTETGEVLHTLWNGPFALDIAPNDRQMAVASADGSVRIVDIATGGEVRKMIGHGGWVTSVDWSSDGRYIASAGIDRAIVLWDATTGALVQTLLGHEKMIYDLVFTPDSRTILSVGEDGRLIEWQLDGSSRLVMQANEPLRSIGVYGESPLAIVAARDPLLVDVRRGRVLGILHDPMRYFGSSVVEPHPASNRVATVGADGDVTMWTIQGTLGAPVEDGRVETLVARPNPASDRIAIDFVGVASGAVHIDVVDATGRSLVARVEQVTPGRNRATIDVAGLAAGVYLVTVRGAGVDAHARVVVAR